MKPVKNRFFFYTLAIPAFVAMVVEFSIASNLGWTPIDVEWRRTGDEVAGVNRQIRYVRYIGWFLIWPILTVAILLTSVVPTLYILWTCFLTASMAVLATVGALVRSDYKWAYYVFWLFAWLLVGYHLIWLPRKYANTLGLDVFRIHNVSSGLLWALSGYFLWAHWNIDPARLGLTMRTYEDPLPGTLVQHEKQTGPAPAAGVTNGAPAAAPVTEPATV